MEVNITPVEGNTARKRIRNKSQWKRNVKKRERYSSNKPPNINKIRACKHNSGKLKCNTLNPQDIRKFHQTFYSKPDKVYQDNFMLKYMKAHAPVRRRRKIGQRAASISYTKFFMRTYVKPYKLVQVCQKTFANILGVGVHRLRNISKKFLLKGEFPQENRGGDRISRKNLRKKENVKTFIETFKCIESHYCRSATSTRKYVPSDLNIKKMWKIYEAKQEDVTLKVKECYFRNIFVKHYNIGFKTPSTDVCSKCLELKEKIKVERNEAAKVEHMTALRIHKLKAKMFFIMLRENDEKTFTISFDCQKNQVLPKVADQAAYYSRQLYIYNFTIVIGTSTNKFPKENVRIYTWTENVHAKSSNEIASAVYHLLAQTNLTDKTKIRIMADGCGSQNKNSTMIAMCAYWLTTSAPGQIKRVELIFPVPGHSFMPADRIFGLIEKEIKNKEQIINPIEYHDIFSNYGVINHLGRDVPVKDWKTFASETMKAPGQYHFRFAECKRYYLSRVKNRPGRFLLRGEVNYKTDLGVARSVIKRGVSKLSDYDIRDVPPFQVNVSALKLSDVDKLLSKHYGDNWKSEEQLSFYKLALERIPDGGGGDEQIDEICEHLEEVGMSI